jgi:hypothetical protein
MYCDGVNIAGDLKVAFIISSAKMITKLIFGSNVDGEQKMALLSSYKDWLTSLHKTNQKAFAAKRVHMKDILL